MKKLFLSVAVMATSMAFAQSIGFGAKAGVNVSNMTNEVGDTETLQDAKAKVGYYAGLFVNVPVGANFSVQPEVMYNNVGQKFDYELLGNKASIKNNLDYISVPIMAQYNIFQGLYLEAGPQFSFLVNQKNKISDIDNDTVKDAIENALNTGDYKDVYKTFDLGLGIGAGYKVYKNIGVNVRYVVGLTNDGKADNTTIKNNTFQAGVTIGF